MVLTRKSSIVTAKEFMTSASMVSSSRSMRSIFFRMACRAASEHRAAKSAPTWPWVSLATFREKIKNRILTPSHDSYLIPIFLKRYTLADLLLAVGLNTQEAWIWELEIKLLQQFILSLTQQLRSILLPWNQNNLHPDLKKWKDRILPCSPHWP